MRDPVASPVTPLPRLPEQAARPVALEVEGLWKLFGSARDIAALHLPDATHEALARKNVVGAVCDASFAIGRGEVFVLMGLSGSGKSTLLRCMTRLIEPTRGAVRIDGTDLCTASPAELIEIRRKKMGMVFQHFALLPNRTVLGNIAFPLEVQGVARDAAQARARALIETVGLSGREDRYPAQLSGGQQQRIGIARSLATDPAFWFLDEPFSALDPLIRADLQDELLRLQRQLAKTVVFVTHDLDEAIRIADRIAIMEAGRIVQIDTPERLVTRPATDYVRRFVANVRPARVVRVASLMRPAGVERPAGDPVAAEATIEAIAQRLLTSGPALPVVSGGGVVGVLSRDAALRVLAGDAP